MKERNGKWETYYAGYKVNKYNISFKNLKTIIYIYIYICEIYTNSSYNRYKKSISIL